MGKILKLLVTVLLLSLCFLMSCTDDPVTGEFNSFDLIPTNLSASDGEYDNKVSIKWNSIPEATGYNLKRRDDPKIGEFELIAENISDTFFIDSILTVGIKYYYKVNSIFESVSDTSTFSDLEEGFAGSLDTSINDTGDIDTTTDPDFIILNASDGLSDSVISLSWTNCGDDYEYLLLGSSYEDSIYSILDSNLTDTNYIHKEVLPGPYSYKIKAINSITGDSMTSTDVGYRLISNLEFFLEVNKTYKYSQAKVGKLNSKSLGVETVGGDHHGTLEYNSYLEGLSSAKAILTYDNYKDFYLTLDGKQSTNIEALFAQDGKVSDTVNVDGIYKGFVGHNIKVTGGNPSGGYYSVGQEGKESSDIQFSEVKDEVLD